MCETRLNRNYRIRNQGVSQKVVSKFISLIIGHPYPQRSFLIGAAIVLLVLYLPNGYSQNEREPVTPAVETPAIQNSSKGGQVVNVKEYGAVGDGITNDTVAFSKALVACAIDGGTCLVPEGTYLISPSGISTGGHRPSVLSGVHLVGAGRGASILKIAGMPTDHFLPCDGDNWSVENLTLDMGDYTPSVGRAAIACKGNNWRVSNCRILKIGRSGIAAFGGNNWSIEGNYC